MVLILLLAAAIVFGVCFGGGKKNGGILGAIVAILYFPIGVIMALAKKYK